VQCSGPIREGISLIAAEKLLAHKQKIIGLLKLLVEKTKGERGYYLTGHLIAAILSTLGTIYTTQERFVDADEWESPGNFVMTFDFVPVIMPPQSSIRITIRNGVNCINPRM
jgi:hypothetical protein